MREYCATMPPGTQVRSEMTTLEIQDHAPPRRTYGRVHGNVPSPAWSLFLKKVEHNAPRDACAAVYTGTCPLPDVPSREMIATVFFKSRTHCPWRRVCGRVLGDAFLPDVP